MALRVTVFCLALLTATTAAAQSQPRLEIGARQGNYYWVVETAADGTRKGGWVPVSVPLEAIDRSALKPLPPFAPVTQQPRPQPSTSVQHLQTREGFWFNGGLGVGFAGCVGCVGREVGTSGGLSLGGTIGDRVLLGVGTSGWYKSIDGIALSGGTFDARVRFYPAASSGFFLTAGGGLGSIAVSDGFLSERETGVGLLFGLGWDLRVGRNVSLTPFYNGFAMGVDSGTFFVDQFGVGVTIH